MPDPQTLSRDSITIAELNAIATTRLVISEPEVACVDDCGCDDCDVAD